MKKLFTLFLLSFFISASLCQAQNPTLWGMTSVGGISPFGRAGTIFSYDIVTGKESVMHKFGTGDDGDTPNGSLIRATNGLVYGMTAGGGVYDSASLKGGIIFSYDISTGAYHDLHDFGSGFDGFGPNGSLMQASNGLLYGMTSSGGAYDNRYSKGGIIFSYDISTGNYADLHDFGSGFDGFGPEGSLVQASNGLLYGVTAQGGIYQDTACICGGIIFSYDISTGIETDLHDFGSGMDGFAPEGSLLQADNGILYGMTRNGGSEDAGTIFSYDISTGSYSDLHDFGNGTGRYPAPSLLQASNGLLYGMTNLGGVNDRGIIFSYDISTGKESRLYHFEFTTGDEPSGALIQASNGFLYGMTNDGGTNLRGTIFSYDITERNETELYDFFASDTDGWSTPGDLLEVDIPTGINDISKPNFDIQLYPNPSSSTINLSLKLPQEQNINLRLFNTLGQQVWAEDLGKTKQIETTIPVMNLANGVYILKVNSGGSWQEKEIVVAR